MAYVFYIEIFVKISMAYVFYIKIFIVHSRAFTVEQR